MKNFKTLYFEDLVNLHSKMSDESTILRCLYYQVFHLMCDRLDLVGKGFKSRIDHTKLRNQFVKTFKYSIELRNKIESWKKLVKILIV